MTNAEKYQKIWETILPDLEPGLEYRTRDLKDQYLYSGHWLEVAGVKVTSVDTAHDYLVAAMRVGEEDGTVVRWTDRPRMWMLAKDNATVLREAAEVVYAELGGGYPESVYEDAMAILLREQRIQHNRQFAVDILFRGQKVGMHYFCLLYTSPSPRDS